MTEEKNDLVNNPSHYEKCKVVFEVVDLTERLPHALGAAIEYILRAPYKGSEKVDLEKAIWWLKRFRDVYLRIINSSAYPLTPTTSTVMAAFCLVHEPLSSLVTRDGSVLYISEGTINRTIEKLEKRIAEIENDD